MVRTLAITIALVGVACGSGGSGDPPAAGSSGGALGAGCLDYTSCGSGLYCFVQGAGVEGKCETLPSECSSGSDCSCLADTLSPKCTSRASCRATAGRSVVACPDAEPKKEGEACTVMRGCEKGLYCRVAAATRTGKCEKMPAACAADPSCECMKAEGCAGSDLRECSIVGDRASVVCE